MGRGAITGLRVLTRCGREEPKERPGLRGLLIGEEERSGVGERRQAGSTPT